MVLFDTLLPLFAIIGIGWFAVRNSYLGAETVQAAGQIVLRIALPSLIFLALASSPAGEVFDPRFLLVYGAGSLGVLILCYSIAMFGLRLDKGASAVVALGVSMANSGFLGFPIGQALLGQERGIRIFAHTLIVENILILPIALLLMALAGGEATPPLRKRLVRQVLLNPLIIALVAGGLVTTAGLGLPESLRAVLDLLSRLSAPLALLVIGGMLASLPIAGRAASVGLIVLGKLVLHPLAVALAALVVSGTAPEMIQAGVLFAAMPMITIFPLLAGRVGQGQFAAFGLLAATLGGFVTIPVVIYLLGLVQP